MKHALAQSKLILYYLVLGLLQDLVRISFQESLFDLGKNVGGNPRQESLGDTQAGILAEIPTGILGEIPAGTLMEVLAGILVGPSYVRRNQFSVL